jgi:hypothetical protein
MGHTGGRLVFAKYEMVVYFSKNGKNKEKK